MSDLGNNLSGEQNKVGNFQSTNARLSFVSSFVVISSGEMELNDMPSVIENLDVSTAFVLDHNVYGLLDTSTLNEPSSYVTKSIINPNNIWKTELTSKETDFWVDTSLTDCTVDNENQSLIFSASNETFQTNHIALTTTDIDKAKLSIGNITAGAKGSLNFELSSDGGINFNTANIDEEIEFDNPGTGLILRVTSNSAGTVSIRDVYGNKNPIKIKYGVSDIFTSLHEYYNVGDDVGQNLSKTTYGAQTFTVGNVGPNENHNLNKIAIKCHKTGSPGTTIIAIQGVDLSYGHLTPNNIDLVTAAIAESDIPTSSEWLDVAMPSYMLQQGTRYALVIKPTSTGNFNWRFDNDDATYSGGGKFRGAVIGQNVTWIEDSNDDHMFEIYGKEV